MDTSGSDGLFAGVDPGLAADCGSIVKDFRYYWMMDHLEVVGPYNYRDLRRTGLSSSFSKGLFQLPRIARNIKRLTSHADDVAPY